MLEYDGMSKAVATIITELKRHYNHPNVIRKSMQRAFDIIRQPENDEKCEKVFSPFLLEIGVNFPEEIKSHSLPFILSFMESDVSVKILKMYCNCN